MGKYQRKTRDLWDILGNYGQGWEVLTCATSLKEKNQHLREYRENEPQRQFKSVKYRERIGVVKAFRNADEAFYDYLCDFMTSALTLGGEYYLKKLQERAAKQDGEVIYHGNYYQVIEPSGLSSVTKDFENFITVAFSINHIKSIKQAISELT
jgi:hypothetical protein